MFSSNPSDLKIWPLLPFQTADSKSGEEKSHYPLHTNHGTPSSAKQDRQDGHLRSAPPWEAPGSAEGL